MKRILLILSALVVLGGIIFVFFGVRVNGYNGLFTSKEDIIKSEERVDKTVVHIGNKAVDITSAISKKCNDFDIGIGWQTVGVKTTVDKAKLIEIIRSKVKLDEFRILDENKLYDKVVAGAKSGLDDCIKLKYKKSDIEKYKSYINWNINYKKKIKFINMKDYVSISKDGVKVNYKFLDKIVSQVKEKYNTVYKPIKFKTHNKKNIKIMSYNSTWYTRIAEETEKYKLKAMFKEGKSDINREPTYNNEWGVIMNWGKIPKTYVEVDINNQHVYYYKNGKLNMDSPCVTGTKGKHDTPKGVYFISEYLPKGKVLKGDGYATRVYKWMRLTGTGVGLHDAYWRGTFGGNIYKSSGSHGCINLPSSFASKLCKKVKWGTCVVVH